MGWGLFTAPLQAPNQSGLVQHAKVVEVRGDKSAPVTDRESELVGVDPALIADLTRGDGVMTQRTENGHEGLREAFDNVA